ncbi:MAG TPA: YihY/virulence factor BrkB family protein [Lachnospiraceae bacterium]|nr:YihY/virulence factor BrkB family protein [Lachnospiraceae bacterium]
MKKIKLLGNLLSEMKKDNVSAHASSAAYFLFLSLIPILILVCSILPYTPIKEADFMLAVTDLLPKSMDPFVVSMIEEIYGKSPTMISITAFVTVWSAAKGILAIMRGLNAINEVGESRNYFVVRFWATIYTLILLGMIILCLSSVVFGNVIVGIIVRRFPQIKTLISFLMYFRFLLVWGVLTFLFICLYAWIPNKKSHGKTQIIGACFTGVGWSIFSYCFSIYIDRADGFKLYGSLTTIIIIMLWLYICMYILMIGAEINSLLDSE